MSDPLAVDRHYGAGDISARILDALERAGRDLAALERADLAPFDEFHGGGLRSTRDLARFAGAAPGMQVADVGCGIGGPARTLADEFGCTVTGVDLTAEFVRAADMLTARLGMQDRCSFRVGSATALPLPDAGFDLVWSQNMMMNVADKAAFFAEAFRVLRPGGRFAFEAVTAGNGEPVHLPTFWASAPEHNWLVTQGELGELLAAAGFEAIRLEDTTAEVLESSRRRRGAVDSGDPTVLGIHVIVPDDVGTKMANALRNIEDGRTATVKGLATRPA
ncbi:MAG: class I SAM-dependent methyltransferase [Gammaproteobacteria bacterium]